MNSFNISNKKQDFHLSNFESGVKARLDRVQNKKNADRVKAIAMKSRLFHNNPEAAKYLEQRGYNPHRMPMKVAKKLPSGLLNSQFMLAKLRQQQEALAKKIKHENVVNIEEIRNTNYLTNQIFKARKTAGNS